MALLESVGLTLADAVFLLCVLVFAGVVRGAVGFAFPLIATPMVMQVFDPKVAIAAMVIPLIATNGQVLVQERFPRSFVREHPVLVGTLVVTTIVGVVGLAAVSVDVVLLVVSAYLLFYLWFSRYGEAVRAYATRRGAGVATGAATGLLGGTIGMAAPPIVTYLDARDVDKNTFVPVLATLFLTIQLLRLPTMYLTGLFGALEVALGVGFVIPSMVGTYFGIRSRSHISQQRFSAFVRVVLLILAIKLGLDGLGLWPL